MNPTSQPDHHDTLPGNRPCSNRTAWLRTLVAGAAVGAIAVGVATFSGGTSTTVANAVVSPPTTTNTPTTMTRPTTPTTTNTPTPTPTPTSTSTVRTVTVTGHGSVKVKPDTATLSLGVAVSATTANGALRDAATKTSALIKALQASGVAADDLVTDGISLYPNYDTSGATVTGYNVSNNVTATIHDITTVGAVIDASASLVGDGITISGVTFSLSADSDALSQARTAAVADAAHQAGDFTLAAGESVGQVLSINESSTGDQPYSPSFSAASPNDSAATPIQTGTQDVAVDVTITYELR